MATFTQHRQPYGPLQRQETVVDGIVYVVVRGDWHPGLGRKYSLRRAGVPGVPDASCYVSDRTLSSEAAMREAVRRLLG